MTSQPYSISQPDLVVDGLGTHWEILRNMFKPYPCGVVLNPVIDACLAVRSAPGFEAARIARVIVRGNPLLKARAERPDVTTGREAQVSAQHAVAISLLRGLAGAADFSDAAVAAPDVLAVRAKVAEVAVDEGIPVEAAEIAITFESGQAITLREDNATGSLRQPMSDAALRAKFGDLSCYGAPKLDPAPLAEQLWRLPEVRDVAELVELARQRR